LWEYSKAGNSFSGITLNGEPATDFNMNKPFPLGKLPPEFLSKILKGVPCDDPRVIVGPGVGLDCAVVDMGGTCLVFKSDPITFATDEIGWYAVQINANDIVTTGATPRWFLVTSLFPEERTTTEDVERIASQLFEACRSLGISVIGGHTEITYGIERPILVGTMIGEVPRDKLITPQGASPGDRILLTKGVPIEGTAILAREFPGKLAKFCTPDEIRAASAYLYDPGISVVKDTRIARQAGRITAMHDPTESGVAGALWELAEACGCTLVIDPQAIPISSISRKICTALEINPLATIASGALILTAPPGDAPLICKALQEEGIRCVQVGSVEAGPSQVWQETAGNRTLLHFPERDEITRVFES
jgi:hydrogenase expression/formation protein HypE